MEGKSNCHAFAVPKGCFSLNKLVITLNQVNKQEKKEILSGDMNRPLLSKTG